MWQIKGQLEVRGSSWVTLSQTSSFIKAQCVCRLLCLLLAVISNALGRSLSHRGIQYQAPKRWAPISRIRVIS